MNPKSVADKLLVKPNATVWSSDPSRLGLIEPLPQGVRNVDNLAEATTALVFAEDAGSLRKVLESNKKVLSRPSAFWVAYPKANRASRRLSMKFGPPCASGCSNPARRSSQVVVRAVRLPLATPCMRRGNICSTSTISPREAPST
jgi:hypothetical protein